MNKVIISGNLCRDIELRETSGGKSVVQNSLAVKNDFVNTNGERESQFINVVFWNHSAKFISDYAVKGTKILVEGRLQTRKYEKEGQERIVTEVISEKVELIGSKKENIKNQDQVSGQINTQSAKEEKDPFADFGESIEIADDILE